MKTQFHYRVVGIASTAAQVLLHRSELDDFWSLPGGHVEFGETAPEALKREFLEETGVAVEVGSLLWVVENFFTYQGSQHHELGLYFLLEIPQDWKLLHQESFFGSEILPHSTEPLKMIFRWFPRNPAVLTQLPLLPKFLQGALHNFPDETQYLINRE